MCQQGSVEVHLERKSEMGSIYKKYEDYEAGKISLTDDELRGMAVRLMVLKY